MKDVINHYDALIDAENDPFYDGRAAREYMDKWDGQTLIDELFLNTDASVLELGVGTGRLAARVAGKCRRFVGIDISPKTVLRAQKNLAAFENVSLVNANFLDYKFSKTFDTVYSSLIFLHIEDKERGVKAAVGALKKGGRFVLSICKDQSKTLVFEDRTLQIYPDNPTNISFILSNEGFTEIKVKETEFAYIISAKLA